MLRVFSIQTHFYRVKGGLAVGIPGEIAGYWKAYQLGGRLPWKKLFEPTINYCRNGVKVSEAVEEITRIFQKELKSDQTLRKWFINPRTNNRYRVNETVFFPELANTLEIIADKGPSAFYDGELSQVIVDEINLNGKSVYTN